MTDKSNKVDLIPSILILLAVLSIALAGCAPDVTKGDPTSLIEPAQPQGNDVTAAPDEVREAATPADAAADTTLVAPPVVLPTVRQELYASDPAQFQLAGGEIQFVEFFAFW